MDTNEFRKTERMISRSDVLRTLGLKSPTTVYKLINENGIPGPYEISPGRKCWAQSDVQD